MDGFVLILCGSMDDMPVRLFSTRAEALKFAEVVKPGPVDGTGSETTDPALLAAATAFGRGPDVPFGYLLVEFRAGLPIGVEEVGDWDADPDEPTPLESELGEAGA